MSYWLTIFLIFAAIGVSAWAIIMFLIGHTPIDKDENGRDAEARVHEIEDSVRGKLE